MANEKSFIDEAFTPIKSFFSPSENTENDRRVQTYNGSALLSLILYYAGFYLLGLFSNIIFLIEMEKTKKLNGGVAPNGSVFLIILLVYHLAIPSVAVFIWILTFGFGLAANILGGLFMFSDF